MCVCVRVCVCARAGGGCFSLLLVVWIFGHVMFFLSTLTLATSGSVAWVPEASPAWRRPRARASSDSRLRGLAFVSAAAVTSWPSCRAWRRT